MFFFPLSYSRDEICPVIQCDCESSLPRQHLWSTAMHNTFSQGGRAIEPHRAVADWVSLAWWRTAWGCVGGHPAPGRKDLPLSVAVFSSAECSCPWEMLSRCGRADYLAVAPRAAHFSGCLSLLVREKKVNAEVFDQMVSKTQHTGYLHSELLSGLGENQITKFVAQVAKLSSFSFTFTSLE